MENRTAMQVFERFKIRLVESLSSERNLCQDTAPQGLKILTEIRSEDFVADKPI